MKIDIEIKNKDETITCKGHGFLFFPIIHLTNTPQRLIKSDIKLDNKMFGGGRIREYYDTRPNGKKDKV